MNLKEYPEQVLIYFDLPFSFVADTLLLPIDITETCKEARKSKPANNDNAPPNTPLEPTSADPAQSRTPVPDGSV
jgi:hypothetical protein